MNPPPDSKLPATRPALVRQPHRRRDELEFLPAAVEILETPASPTGRLLAMAICLFLLIAVGWSIIGTIDIVAVAQGRLVPSGHTKVIQPLEVSVVRSIRVEDGMSVQAGDVLVELDPTAPTADRERLLRDRMEAGLAVARLRAILDEGTADAFEPPADADPAVARVQQDMFRAQLAERAAKLSAIDREIEAHKADADAIAAEIKKLKGTVPLLRQRVEARRTLVEQNYSPKLELLELEEQLIRERQDLEVAKARLTQAKAEIANAETRRLQAEAEFRRDRLAELTDAEQRAAQLSQELIKTERRQGLQQLVAPVDGVVQQLAIHTVGGVVTEAQQLMVIVPSEQRLQVEATLLNKDIGFVQAGQPAAIKIETFLFTRYGTIDGEVLQVSGDAVADDQMGLVYPTRISMSRATINVDGKMVNLGPGMAATVEIKTGKRRLIEYLLSPLLRYGQESLRER